MATNPPGFRLAFDVTNLDKTCEFYRSLGGFEVASTTRKGEIFETRELVSPGYPGVTLIARLSFGKRAVGTSPGSITSVGLPVSSLPDAIRRLSGKAKWACPNPEANPDEPRQSVSLMDPDAYLIELYKA